jgi:hypothetical protein
VKKRVIIVGSVVLAVLLFAILLSVHRDQPQAIKVRHVKSVQSSNVITMTFEVTNHSTDTYMFDQFDVAVRNDNAWARIFYFPGMGRVNLLPRGSNSYELSVLNLPTNSVVRYSFASNKVLLGVEGFLIRVKINLQQLGHGHRWISLNPYDKNSHVYGKPIEVFSEEWVETAK